MSKIHYIDKAAVRGILENLKGRVCTITAIKNDGSTTKHNGQLQDSPKSHDNHSHLFTIKRMTDGGFRSFSDSRVTRIAGNGLVYQVSA